MISVKYLLPVVAGILVGIVMNKICIPKQTEKSAKIILSVISVVLCVIVFALFSFAACIRPLCGMFFDKQISNLEINAESISPGIFDEEIDISNIKGTLQTVMDSASEFQAAEKSGVVERFATDYFAGKITDMIQTSTGLLNEFDGGWNTVSIRSVLSGIKEIALNNVEYCGKWIKLFSGFLLLIYFVSGICISIYLRKGKSLYNRSVTFGDDLNNADKS